MADAPPVDPTQLLGKLKALVDTNKDPKGGGKSWVSTLVLACVALVAAAIWAWVSWRRNQELAKLRHAKFEAEVKAEAAVVDAKLQENSAHIESSQAVVRAAQEQVRVIDADIRTEEARHAAVLRAIDRIHTWRDVDPSAR